MREKKEEDGKVWAPIWSKKRSYLCCLECGTKNKFWVTWGIESQIFGFRAPMLCHKKKPYDVLGHERTHVLYTIIITLQWILTNLVDATNRLRYRWIWCCGLVQQPCNSWPPPASKFYHLCRWRHCDKTLLWIHLMSHSLTSLECQNFSTNLPFYTADSNIDSMSATGRTEIPIVSYFCWPVVRTVKVHNIYEIISTNIMPRSHHLRKKSKRIIKILPFFD